MSTKQTAAQFIASAVLQRLEGNTIRFGLLARNIPLFDPQVLYNQLIRSIAEQKLCLALIGFSSVEIVEGVQIATSIEKTVEWRNDPGIRIPVVVILNPQAQHEKIHSLEMFDTFEDADLRRHICTIAAETSSGDQKLIWEVLKRADFIKSVPLVAAQALDYYVALQEDKTPGDALPYLGLMCDTAISQYTKDRGILIKRLQENHRQVKELLFLEKKSYRSLARASDNEQIDRYRQTFLYVQAYMHDPSLKHLQRLVFDNVMNLYNAPKVTPNLPKSKVTSKTPSDVIPETMDECLVEQVLDDGTDLQEVQEIVHERVLSFREDPNTDQVFSENAPDITSTKFIIDGQELVFPLPVDKEAKHPLEDFMRQWVQVEIWGGIVSREPVIEQELPIQKIFDEATALKFTPLQPLRFPQGDNEAPSLLALFKSLDNALDRSNGSQEKLEDLLRDLHSYRSELAAYRTIFLYEPITATIDSTVYRLIESYIQSYDRLANQLQRINRTADRYRDSIELATAQFLALDVVIVDRPHSESALLTTLHPLHLWKWAELARRLSNKQEELRPIEKAIIVEASKHLPTILNTFLLDPKMFQPPRHLDEPRLVLAGEIPNLTNGKRIGIPFYEPIVRQLGTTAGMDQLAILIQDFLALYPPARLGLVITLIDPPTLLPILKSLAGLNKQGGTQTPILYGVQVNVYRTDPQAIAYDLWTMEDNETLELFRQNPCWTFHIDLVCGNYEKISSTIEKKGLNDITVLFDPSTAVVQPAWRTSQELANPFIVPIQVGYDSITDTVRITQSPTSAVFDSYMRVRNALTGEVNFLTFGIGNKSEIKSENLESLIKSCQWLIVVDHPHGTLQLSSIGQRLAWFPTTSRTVSVYTLDRERWREHLTDHLSQFPLRVNFDVIEPHLADVLTVFPNGLLATVAEPPIEEKETTHRALLENSLESLLSSVATLYWYRQDNPSTVLLNLKSDNFRDWLGDQEQTLSKEADYLLALYYSQGKLHTDILKVSASASLSLSEENKCLNQLTNLAETLERLFTVQSDQLLISPIRSERLRELLSTAIFAPSSYYMTSVQRNQRTTIKAGWADIINNLFSAYKPIIRLRSIRVALHRSEKVDIQTLNIESDGYPRDVVTLPGTLLQIALDERSSDDFDSYTKSIPVAYSAVDPELPEPQMDKPDRGGQVPFDGSEETEKKHSDQIQTQADELRRALIAYGIAVASVDTEKTQVGPRIIRYWVKLQPPAGRLAEVQKYAVDLARELCCEHVPMIDNIPGESYIGIDIERKKPEFIPFGPALKSLPLDQPDKLIIAMGVDLAGKGVEWDLVRLPHMLVAGSTGSGKSTFLSTLITGLAWCHPSKELELLLIDPKKVDFTVFSRLPHLRGGQIFYNASEAISTLRQLIENEAEYRTNLLQQAHCPNILEFNRRNPERRLSWIVIVVDEFVYIMNSLSRSERDTFEKQMSHLAATGRFIGIHLVLATQRPTTDIITGTIKANIPARITFSLPSAIDSRTILDSSGAEHLLGRGDMLAFCDGRMQRLQSYFATYEEIEELLKHISRG